MELAKSNVLERIGTNKVDGWHRCIICHYWYFLKISFKFQTCSGCLDKKIYNMLQWCYDFGENDYKIHIWFVIKIADVDRMKNAKLSENI